MKLYLVRHGMTANNAKKAFNSNKLEEVSQEGIEDLKKKRVLYKDINVDYFYCSPLIRAKQSFDILFEGKKPDEYRNDLEEMDFGDWAGIKYVDKFNELELLGYNWDDYVDPENGETYENLFKRTCSFLQEVELKHLDNNETVVVLSHGIVIAAIIQHHFLPEENLFKLSPENGLGYLIEYKEDDIITTKLEFFE